MSQMFICFGLRDSDPVRIGMRACRCQIDAPHSHSDPLRALVAVAGIRPPRRGAGPRGAGCAIAPHDRGPPRVRCCRMGLLVPRSPFLALPRPSSPFLALPRPSSPFLALLRPSSPPPPPTLALPPPSPHFQSPPAHSTHPPTYPHLTLNPKLLPSRINAFPWCARAAPERCVSAGRK
jgi:hypothetical protein